MKTKTFAIIALVTIVALTSCNSEEENVIETSKYITVSGGIGSLTRVTTTTFEKDDQISVYAWTDNAVTVSSDLVVNNSINTFDGASWTANPMMLWRNMETAHYFIGVHPTKAITNFTADSYTTIVDVLVATELAGRNASQGIVPLTFDHIMGRLDVNLNFRDQWEGIPSVTDVAVEAKPKALVDYISKTTIADGAEEDINLNTITANTAYSNIIVPQTVHKIHIMIDGKTYTYNNVDGIELIAGKIQTVNLNVGRDRITLGSITINPWDETTPPIDGGEAQID